MAKCFLFLAGGVLPPVSEGGLQEACEWCPNFEGGLTFQFWWSTSVLQGTPEC